MNTHDPLQSTRQAAQAALIALLAFSATMFAAALAGLQPSPPPDKLPFVATNLSLGLAACWLLAQRHRAAGGMALLSAIAWLPSVGPHKFFTEVHAPQLAPVIVVGSACVLVLALAGVRLLRRQREAIARGRVQPG